MTRKNCRSYLRPGGASADRLTPLRQLANFSSRRRRWVHVGNLGIDRSSAVPRATACRTDQSRRVSVGIDRQRSIRCATTLCQHYEHVNLEVPPSQLLPRMRRQRCKSHLALSRLPDIRKQCSNDDNRTTHSLTTVSATRPSLHTATNSSDIQIAEPWPT